MKSYHTFCLGLYAGALVSVVVGCTGATQKAATVVVDTNAALSSPEAQQGFQMACWLVSAGDAAYRTFRAPKAPADEIADEQKAISGALAICNDKPTDLVSATKAVMDAYKAVTAKVPAS